MAAKRPVTPSTKKAAKAPAKKAAAKTSAKPAAAKPSKAVAKKSTKATAAKKAPPAFGRAGTAGKAQGDAPVRAYIAGLPAPQRAIAQLVDDIVAKNVPGVRRAIKWSMPMYGLEGQGWFCSFGAFAKHTAVMFFRGKELNPQPPEGSGKEGRRITYRELKDVDEKQLAAWVKQASAIPGWGS